MLLALFIMNNVTKSSVVKIIKNVPGVREKIIGILIKPDHI